MNTVLARNEGGRNVRILCHFNHFFGSGSDFVGKSTSGKRDQRSAIVSRTLSALRSLPFDIHVRVCGFVQDSLLPIDVDLSAERDPQRIVYASIERMFDSLTSYDYFLNVEDDILIEAKALETMMSFNAVSHVNEVYLPNRMERGNAGEEYCVDLMAMPDWSRLRRVFAGSELSVARNPHSGMAFLSRDQMCYARERVDVSRRDKFLGGFMASAYANLHEPFLMWRSRTVLSLHQIEHLDRWLASERADDDAGVDALGEALGHIDQVTIEGENAVIRGWAFSSSGEGAMPVLVEFDGREVTEFEVLQVPRMDVANAHAHASVHCGFEVRLPMTSLADLAGNVTEFAMLASDRRDGSTFRLARGTGVNWPVSAFRDTAKQKTERE
jgi:hypothetical protein